MGPIAFDDNDAKMVQELVQEGLDVYFQPVPDDQAGVLERCKEKALSGSLKEEKQYGTD